MSRRRMMMQKKEINLFDNNSEDIIYKARLNQDGTINTNSDSNTVKTFVSPYIKVSPDTTYILRRAIISSTNAIFNRWCFYSDEKLRISYSGSTVINNIITIPKGCSYIRFNGLITDIDNVKFYKA